MLREALLFGHQALKAPKGTGGGLHRAGGRIWELLTSIIEEFPAGNGAELVLEDSSALQSPIYVSTGCVNIHSSL